MNEKALVDMEQELCRLYGETSYSVTRRHCTGDYRGHNDYSILFGSGRHLSIGLDKRGYGLNLPRELELIRYFQAHREENSAAILKAISGVNTKFVRAKVEIVPQNDLSLCVWACVILETKEGENFLYRETQLHYGLTCAEGTWWEGGIKAMLRQLQLPSSTQISAVQNSNGETSKTVRFG